MECENCGCNDVVKCGKRMRYGRQWQRWRCNHCGKEFTEVQVKTDPKVEETPLKVVEFVAMTCPKCSSRNVKVRSTDRSEGEPTIRKHKCFECGWRFQSTDKATC